VPIPCFLLFLCFRKVTQEIFSELDKTKAEVPIFSDTRQSLKQRWRVARGRPRHAMVRATPGDARLWGGPLVHCLKLSFRLYILLDEKTLRPVLFSRKHTASRRRRRREIGRVQKLFLTPCQRGESPPEAFFITMPASGVMCE
jgi:hypothetical protein